MAAIDTNVLVRLVTRDDAAQAEKADVFVTKHQPVLVTQLSVLELVWVLMSSYGMGKAKVIQVVRALLEMAELDLERPALLEAALETWEGAKADFADCFILETVKAASETPLGAFDATLAKLEGCKRL
ncbi:MAG: type II toxin-antitoxin system VapC family toxin [Acidobacteria bacterium]|nr:type II toxin-antitoxin system VapC family toxin [Acidobacteriota bacterium]